MRTYTDTGISGKFLQITSETKKTNKWFKKIHGFIYLSDKSN